MLSLKTPPSPSPSPRPPLPLPPKKHSTPISLNQIIISKQTLGGTENRAPRKPISHIKRLAKRPILIQTRQRRTNPLVWCCAIMCLIFSLVLIFCGIAALILFLVVRPTTPVFNTPNARLSTIYFDSPEYLNGDFTFVANFSNPNRKLDIRFEYMAMELYFADRRISAQALQPFTQRPREARLESVHLISSLVYLPQNHAVALRTQVLSNWVNYNIRATFKVRASLGVIHFTYCCTVDVNCRWRVRQLDSSRPKLENKKMKDS